MKFAKTALILISAIGLFGCEPEYKTDINKKIASYTKSDTEKNLYALIETYNEHEKIQNNRFGGVFETYPQREAMLKKWNDFKVDVQVRLAEKNNWNALSSLYDNGMTPHYDASIIALSSYKGEDAILLIAMGEAAYKEGDVYKTYELFEKAALIDHDKADFVRGFAYQYGCISLDRIWAELTKERKKFPGDPIEGEDIGINKDKITKSRINLRKGIAPDIPLDCPLKEF